MIPSTVFKGVITHLNYQKRLPHLNETITAKKTETVNNILRLYDHYNMVTTIPTEAQSHVDDIPSTSPINKKESIKHFLKKKPRNHKKTISPITAHTNHHIVQLSTSRRRNESLPQIPSSPKTLINSYSNHTNSSSTITVNRNRRLLSPFLSINNFNSKCEDIAEECSVFQNKIKNHHKHHLILQSAYYLPRQKDHDTLHQRDIESLEKSKHIREVKEYYMMQKKAQLIQESKIIHKTGPQPVFTEKDLLTNLFTLEGKTYITSTNQDNLRKRQLVKRNVESIDKVLKDTAFANTKITNTLSDYINNAYLSQ